jgi:hypothetical protein
MDQSFETEIAKLEESLIPHTDRATELLIPHYDQLAASLTTPPLPIQLALPPQAIYPTREALFETIQSWSKDRGYAFTIQRSRRRRNRQMIQYACDRCPLPPPLSTQRTRNTQSRGTGCLFSIVGIELSNSLGWEVRYRPEGRYNTHNHPPSQSPAAHPSHRHLSIQAQATIQSLFSSGK